jgi:hypothetical protein
VCLGQTKKIEKMEGDNNAIPQEEEQKVEEKPVTQDDNHNDNNVAIDEPQQQKAIAIEEKEGAERLLPDSSKCPVCLEEPFCGFLPFACDHAICFKCVDPSAPFNPLKMCPICRNDAWVFPLEVKAVGSERERQVIDEIAKIAHIGRQYQETIKQLTETLDDREQARYEEEARKRLEALVIAVNPLTERVDVMSAKIVSESTRRFAVQAGAKLLGLWLIFLLAIASQSLVLSVLLLVVTFSGYVIATEYIAWAEKTHGELLAEGQVLGADLKALDKKHRPERRRHNHLEDLHYYVARDHAFGDRRNAPIVAVTRRRDARQPIAAGEVQLVDNRNRTMFPGVRLSMDDDPRIRANQVVQEN